MLCSRRDLYANENDKLGDFSLLICFIIFFFLRVPNVMIVEIFNHKFKSLSAHTHTERLSIKFMLFSSFPCSQRCIPEFENAAFGVQIDATNTCGEEENQNFCIQTGYSNRKSCDNVCRYVNCTQNRIRISERKMYEKIYVSILMLVETITVQHI